MERFRILLFGKKFLCTKPYGVDLGIFLIVSKAFSKSMANKKKS